MELRLLKTETERRIFSERMDLARAKRGVGFQEAPRSALARVHLAFAELYGLFEENGDPIERMMSGFVMHDLGSYPQSYPRPDLTHYPARSVIECGELWSFSKGAGLLARRGSTIIAGLRQVQAILVYAIAQPWDNTASYTETGFAKPCAAVEFPYAQTMAGDSIWVQPMVLDGEPLQRLVRKVFELGFETWNRHTIIRFPNPLSIQPSLDRPAIPVEPAAIEVEPPSLAAPRDPASRGEINGAPPV
ncbi:MAG TPA: hypothetical protein VEC38_05270 [Candidatus Binataceae bacterium]|nr:hypothetical protein [Candidatus Binataceae bacterium]